MTENRKPKNVFIAGPVTPEFVAKSLASHASKHNIGAHSLFLGQIRADDKNGGEVEAIEYEAYEDMALQTFHAIREDAFAKYNLTCMHIYHSLGRVNVGEISLMVFTSSIHRRDAIEACDYLVERIKKEVQVWGKELVSGGDDGWKNPG